MTVAERIKGIMRDKGLKQCAVAREAGFSSKQFNALLNGRKTFKVDYLIPICTALGCTPDDALGYKKKGD